MISQEFWSPNKSSVIVLQISKYVLALLLGRISQQHSSQLQNPADDARLATLLASRWTAPWSASFTDILKRRSHLQCHAARWAAPWTSSSADSAQPATLLAGRWTEPSTSFLADVVSRKPEQSHLHREAALLATRWTTPSTSSSVDVTPSPDKDLVASATASSSIGLAASPSSPLPTDVTGLRFGSIDVSVSPSTLWPGAAAATSSTPSLRVPHTDSHICYLKNEDDYILNSSKFILCKQSTVTTTSPEVAHFLA